MTTSVLRAFLHAGRQPEDGPPADPFETGRHDAGDGQRHAVDLKGPADDGGIGAKAAAPQAVGEEDERTTGGVVFRREAMSDRGRHLN